MISSCNDFKTIVFFSVSRRGEVLLALVAMRRTFLPLIDRQPIRRPIGGFPVCGVVPQPQSASVSLLVEQSL